MAGAERDAGRDAEAVRLVDRLRRDLDGLRTEAANDRQPDAAGALVPATYQERFAETLGELDALFGTTFRSTWGGRGGIVEADPGRGVPVDSVSRAYLVANLRDALAAVEQATGLREE